MSPAPILAGVFADAAVASAPLPSPAALLFCCAQAGNTKRALITTAAHQLRMILLPQFSLLEPKSMFHPPQCHSLRPCGTPFAHSPGTVAFPVCNNLLVSLEDFPTGWEKSRKQQDAMPLAYSRFPIIRKSFLPAASIEEAIAALSKMRMSRFVAQRVQGEARGRAEGLKRDAFSRDASRLLASDKYLVSYRPLW
jgi:hypothetical protein